MHEDIIELGEPVIETTDVYRGARIVSRFHPMQYARVLVARAAWRRELTLEMQERGE
jgi:hypothetical protein